VREAVMEEMTTIGEMEVHKEQQFVLQMKNCLSWKRHTDERSKTTSHFWPFTKWKKSWPAKGES